MFFLRVLAWGGACISFKITSGKKKEVIDECDKYESLQ